MIDFTLAFIGGFVVLGGLVMLLLFMCDNLLNDIFSDSIKGNNDD